MTDSIQLAEGGNMLINMGQSVSACGRMTSSCSEKQTGSIIDRPNRFFEDKKSSKCTFIIVGWLSTHC